MNRDEYLVQRREHTLHCHWEASHPKPQLKSPDPLLEAWRYIYELEIALVELESTVLQKPKFPKLGLHRATYAGPWLDGWKGFDANGRLLKRGS